jgi:hypothetical protein
MNTPPLRRRVPQASLAAELREPPSPPEPTRVTRDPEAARVALSRFQSKQRAGRAAVGRAAVEQHSQSHDGEAAEPANAADPAENAVAATTDTPATTETGNGVEQPTAGNATESTSEESTR